MDTTNSKTIIIYFSHNGENYLNDQKVVLEEGNVKKCATILSKHLQCESFELEPVKPYSFVYMKCARRAMNELFWHLHPKYKQDIDLNIYDKIILIFPLWIGIYPRIIQTFINTHKKLEGKTIIPISVAEHSLGNKSQKHIAKKLKHCTVKEVISLTSTEAINDPIKKFTK